MMKRTYKPKINKLVIFKPYKNIELVYDMDLKDVVIFQCNWIESIHDSNSYFNSLKKIQDYKTRLVQIKDILIIDNLEDHEIYNLLIKITSKSNANNILDQM
jgi:hypothetical protein